MADTTFVDQVTVIEAPWLNDVNTHAYNKTTGLHPASSITNTPAGTIAATTVQTAIDELDTEKEALTNKSTSLVTDQASDTKYPSVKAVYSGTVVKTTLTGSAVLPASTTANRDGSPAVGYMRYNTSINRFEGYSSAGWGKLGTNIIEAFDFMTPAQIADVESGALTLDVTTALNDFFAAILQTRGRGKGKLNGGLYRCNSNLNPLTSGYIEIEGEGKNGSVLVNYSTTGSLLKFSGASLPLAALSNMGFQQNVATAGQLLELAGNFRFDIGNVFFNGAPGGTNLATGLFLATGTSIYGHNIDGVGFTTFGIKLVGGNDYLLAQGTIQANGVLGRPLWIDSVTGGAIQMADFNFLEGANCLITNSNFGTFKGCYFDSAQGAVAVSGCEELFFTAGCEFANRVSTGTGDGGGIIFGNSKSCQVSNSMVINNGANGISLGADTTNISVIGNYIDGNNTTNTAGVVAGVNVAAGAQGFKIIENTIGNNSALYVGHQKYGIAVGSGASDNYLIANNDLRNNETAGLVDNGTGTNAIVRDNNGFKLGVANAVAGASPYTIPATHYSKTVYVKGGTVSDISVSGVSIYTSTDRTLHLEPNETAIITWSVVPTLVQIRH